MTCWVTPVWRSMLSSAVVSRPIVESISADVPSVLNSTNRPSSPSAPCVCQREREREKEREREREREREKGRERERKGERGGEGG